MKKFFILLLCVCLLMTPVMQTSADSMPLDTMTADELLALRTAVNVRLREMGAYPFISLKSGSKGEEVTALQQRLAELGYYTKEITGSYSTTTANAMKAFEKASGLKQDGNASVQDQIALFSHDAPVKPTPAPTKTPRPTATPNRSKMYPKMDFIQAGRKPDEYKGQRMALTGVILQQISQQEGYCLRVATKGERENIVYVTTKSLEFVPEVNTRIACYGIYEGLCTYQTSEGMEVTLPRLSSEITEQIE